MSGPQDPKRPEPQPMGLPEEAMGPVGEAPTCGAYRQMARTRLEEMQREFRRRADGIGELLKSLPAEPPQAADQALWDILCSVRRM